MQLSIWSLENFGSKLESSSADPKGHCILSKQELAPL